MYEITKYFRWPVAIAVFIAMLMGVFSVSIAGHHDVAYGDGQNQFNGKGTITAQLAESSHGHQIVYADMGDGAGSGGMQQIGAHADSITSRQVAGATVITGNYDGFVAMVGSPSTYGGHQIASANTGTIHNSAMVAGYLDTGQREVNSGAWRHRLSALRTQGHQIVAMQMKTGADIGHWRL